MKKRIITSILAITMMVTMMPMTSFGATKFKAPKILNFNCAPVSEETEEKAGELVYNVSTTRYRIAIKWNTVKNCSGYQVYRKINNAKFKKVFTGTKKDYIYKETNLKGGAKYSFKVRAVYTQKGKKKYSKFTPVKSLTVPKDIAESVETEKIEDKSKRETIDGKNAKDYADMFTEKWYGLYQDYLKTTTKKLTSAEKLIVGKSFNSLSDIQKVYALSQFGYFAGTSGKPCGNYRMVYNSDYRAGLYSEKDLYKMHALYEGTAKGICSDFARCEESYFNLIGIKGTYKQNSNHAWTEISVTNSDGKEFHTKFDYGMILSSTNSNNMPSLNDIY